MQTGGLFLSRDRGQTWSRIEGPLAEGHFPVVLPGPAAAPTGQPTGAPAASGVNTIFAGSATEGLFAVELPSRISVGPFEPSPQPRALAKKPQ
jgi:hypothetical protein